MDAARPNTLPRPHWMCEELHEVLCRVIADGLTNRDAIARMLRDEQVQYAVAELAHHKFDDKAVAEVLRFATVAPSAGVRKRSDWNAMVAQQRADAATLREIAEREPVIALDLRERAAFLEWLADAEPVYPEFQRAGGDDETRIGAVLLAMHVRAHCGQPLCGTVATLVNAATGREIATEEAVRDWMKRAPRS